jgi:hypothetical protein
MLPGITLFSNQIDGAHACDWSRERNTFRKVEAIGAKLEGAVLF